ncbi:diguanylate cyclase (GGDEF)-like protein [Rhodanobacter soli]|uniref:diguanylate cyclase n=2 Tax=Rhodanobacter soli TaxID=590609 RepID=A0ABV2PYD5_9GAMM
MLRLPSRFWSWPVMISMAMGSLVPHCHATTSASDPAILLDQAESLQRKDHSRFVQILAQIHNEVPHLTPEERWRFSYLDAWKNAFEGNYSKSETQLHKVIDHADSAILVAKASALLLTNLGINRRYEEAFTLANRLTAELPQIRDPGARYLVLMNLSQMLDFSGQTDLALKYARMMEDSIPPGETRCLPLNLQIAALYNSKQLTSADPKLQQTVDVCTAAQRPVATNSTWLVLSSLYLDENQPRKAMELLDRIGPSVRTNQYHDHMLSAQVERAQAHAKLGNDNEARKAALSAVAMSRPGDISEWLMVAYQLLYQIEKKQGHSAAALAYYEHYVVQDKGYLNDVSARALAYQVAQQHMLVQRLETEKLSKQNNILRLQQALDTKAVETSRLYITLLLVILASIVLWLFRLKRSQLRFMRLSHRDGLTGILNHQHFITEAGRVLRLLEKKLGHACLISIDLDHFKRVNDTYGHAMGDVVLKLAVAICQQHLRPSDLFGRLGGEEFGILLHDCSRKQGLDIANRIRIAIGTTPMEQDGSGVSISASVGLASTDTSGYELQRLCKEADSALYRAKRAGRNRVIADTEDGNLVEA